MVESLLIKFGRFFYLGWKLAFPDIVYSVYRSILVVKSEVLDQIIFLWRVFSFFLESLIFRIFLGGGKKKIFETDNLGLYVLERRGSKGLGLNFNFLKNRF